MSKGDQKTLNGLLQFYLEKISNSEKAYELEIKFGTRNIKKIDNLDFIRVLKKIKSLGGLEKLLEEFKKRLEEYKNTYYR